MDNRQSLPPGLVDNAVEFFIHQHEIKCLYLGNVYTFDQLPEFVVAIVEQDMLSNPKAMQALASWDITDPLEQMRQYIACRFGGFDNNPDISTKGEVLPAEYVDCGRRGKCPYEGKLCNSIQLPHGLLTKREIEVLKEIGLGSYDKEICEKLSITQDTLRTHKEHISTKAGIERKPALAVLAYKLGLI
ncbi:response regulator transcription factor [Paradesertivirga mongoliensis]|uniref:Response regulator transcription factor n=1 Tax=Paradesertivirga mongoliensis TaxID=2100740 RepID=A0ABW4ZNR1_9SPHI